MCSSDCRRLPLSYGSLLLILLDSISEWHSGVSEVSEDSVPKWQSGASEVDFTGSGLPLPEVPQRSVGRFREIHL